MSIKMAEEATRISTKHCGIEGPIEDVLRLMMRRQPVSLHLVHHNSIVEAERTGSRVTNVIISCVITFRLRECGIGPITTTMQLFQPQ